MKCDRKKKLSQFPSSQIKSTKTQLHSLIQPAIGTQAHIKGNLNNHTSTYCTKICTDWWELDKSCSATQLQYRTNRSRSYFLPCVKPADIVSLIITCRFSFAVAHQLVQPHQSVWAPKQSTASAGISICHCMRVQTVWSWHTEKGNVCSILENPDFLEL